MSQLTVQYRITHLGIIESSIGPRPQNNRLAVGRSFALNIFVQGAERQQDDGKNANPEDVGLAEGEGYDGQEDGNASLKERTRTTRVALK